MASVIDGSASAIFQTPLPVAQGGTGAATGAGAAAALAPIQLGTAQNTTSGTSIDFTGIPAGVKRITVMFNVVSTTGTSILQIQIGSGSVQTSGYTTGWIQGSSGAAAALTALTTGFPVGTPTAANATFSGVVTLVLLNAATGVWAMSGNTGDDTNSRAWSLSGAKILSGVLDRVRLTAVNGTDTFDAGSVNIMWEF